MRKPGLRSKRARANVPQPPSETPGPLPSFVVVGAMKAGTTSLKANLRRHPKVFMPGRELHYFDKHLDQGIEWYQRWFGKGIGKLCGEKTPTYMIDRRTMERMHEVLPDAKLIVLLRDPTARLFSHVNHRIQRKRLPEPERIDMNWFRDEIVERPNRRKEFLDRGLYLKQIRNNILPLYPAENVFIRATDAWAAKLDRKLLETKAPGQLRGTEKGGFTKRLQHEVQDFLGIDRFDPPEYKVSGVRSYKADVDDDVRAFVAQHYAEANERLFEFLGYDIPEWTRPA